MPKTRFGADVPNICESCQTYKALYGAERSLKHLPEEPSIFEVNSATRRNPGSSCPTCNIYMALYATIRRNKPSNYGKITKERYRSYKKIPKASRPPFYVKRCYGAFDKNDNAVHFYEVEELTTHNPFKTRLSKRSRGKSAKRPSWDKPGLIPSHIINSALRRIYTDVAPLLSMQDSHKSPPHEVPSYESPPLEQLLPSESSCVGSTGSIGSAFAEKANTWMFQSVRCPDLAKK